MIYALQIESGFIKFMKMFLRGASLVLMLLLAGCESSEDESLTDWVASVRRTVHDNPVTIPVPLTITPAVYDASGRVDPFDASKISILLDITSEKGNRPDLKRAREPLESYPLDQFRLVGSLSRQGQGVALLEVGKVLHQVRKGDHLGQDLGVVISVRDGAIDIEETVQEANGIWVKRRVQLSIREAK